MYHNPCLILRHCLQCIACCSMCFKLKFLCPFYVKAPGDSLWICVWSFSLFFFLCRLAWYCVQVYLTSLSHGVVFQHSYLSVLLCSGLEVFRDTILVRPFCVCDGFLCHPQSNCPMSSRVLVDLVWSQCPDRRSMHYIVSIAKSCMCLILVTKVKQFYEWHYLYFYHCVLCVLNMHAKCVCLILTPISTALLHVLNMYAKCMYSCQFLLCVFNTNGFQCMNGIFFITTVVLCVYVKLMSSAVWQADKVVSDVESAVTVVLEKVEKLRSAKAKRDEVAIPSCEFVVFLPLVFLFVIFVFLLQLLGWPFRWDFSACDCLAAF